MNNQREQLSLSTCISYPWFIRWQQHHLFYISVHDYFATLFQRNIYFALIICVYQCIHYTVYIHIRYTCMFPIFKIPFSSQILFFLYIFIYLFIFIHFKIKCEFFFIFSTLYWKKSHKLFHFYLQFEQFVLEAISFFYFYFSVS